MVVIEFHFFSFYCVGGTPMACTHRSKTYIQDTARLIKHAPVEKFQFPALQKESES